MSLVGRVFSNRYEIVRPIAHGGMAEVYLGHDRLLDRPVAVKALFPEFAREPSFVERFRREAQAAANLNHPNIVAIYDWGQESGTYFIVMEYVEGKSLRELMQASPRLEPARAVAIAIDIAGALAFAHRNGVVHRDVKPGNVLLTDDGIVKVTDFGVARAGTSDALTQTGSVMGTATYFSPEQAQGLSVDGRSDVYSLGVVLYEMVVGSPPFSGETPVAVAYQHVREAPPAPRSRVPGLPVELEQIILSALAKDVSQRYQSADDLRADLQRFERGRPPTAAPITAAVAATSATGVALGAGNADRTIVQDAVRHPSAVYAKPRSNPGRVIATALTVLVLALAVILILVFASHQSGNNPSGVQVKVPNVQNQTEAQARAALANQGFDVAVAYKVNVVTPVGHVITQSPGPGGFVDKGSTVSIDVSGLQLPDVSNQTVAAATQLLTGKGFKVSATPQVSTSASNVVKGNVMGTNPATGQVISNLTVVTLITSPGPATIPVPDVHGEAPDQAIADLHAAGFTPVTQQSNEASATIAKGLVTRTSPAAGAAAAADQVFTLFVSTGPAQVTVPDVTGFSIASACDQIQTLGLKCTVQYTVSSPADYNRVVDQTPKGNTLANKGDTVAITAGKPATTTTTGATTTTTVATTTTT